MLVSAKFNVHFYYNCNIALLNGKPLEMKIASNEYTLY